MLFDLLPILFLLAGDLITIPILILVSISPFQSLLHKKKLIEPGKPYLPKISLIVPARNEGPVIERTIKAFIDTNYPADRAEMIIVNDGSSDDTDSIARRYCYKIINSDTSEIVYNKEGERNIILVNRRQGGMGKAYAMNDGKRYATGSLLGFIDADVQLGPDVLNRTVRHFMDKDVWAVAGNITVNENKEKILNRFVDFECVIAQRIIRNGYDALGVHYIVPGGYGVFRRQVFDKIGDFSADTLAEDTDLTWKLITETDKRVEFDESIRVTADEPTTLLGLWDQRTRWARGNYAVTMKNRHKMGRGRHGMSTTIGLPFWISNMLIPVMFIFTTLGLLLSMIYPVTIPLIIVFGRAISASFLIIWLFGLYLNKGKSWYAGLISPGIPILVTLFASTFYSGGLTQLLAQVGMQAYAVPLATSLILWIAMSVPGTIILAHQTVVRGKIAEFIQVCLFGYWILLVSSALNGYIKEVRKEEPVWIRTAR